MGTVLVVDDEPDIRGLLARMLKNAGHRVIEAAEGRAGLEALDSDDVDIVLLDLMMPVMDGWAFLWSLHDRDSAPPVIVMSAKPESATRSHPPLGAVRYLVKPFALEIAVGSVAEVLASHPLAS